MKISPLIVRDPVNAFQLNPQLDEVQRLLSALPIFWGNGSPEGQVKANIGSLYFRLDGGTGTTLYVKESTNGRSTGWVAK